VESARRRPYRSDDRASGIGRCTRNLRRICDDGGTDAAPPSPASSTCSVLWQVRGAWDALGQGEEENCAPPFPRRGAVHVLARKRPIPMPRRASAKSCDAPLGIRWKRAKIGSGWARAILAPRSRTRTITSRSPGVVAPSGGWAATEKVIAPSSGKYRLAPVAGPCRAHHPVPHCLDETMLWLGMARNIRIRRRRRTRAMTITQVRRVRDGRAASRQDYRSFFAGNHAVAQSVIGDATNPALVAIPLGTC